MFCAKVFVDPIGPSVSRYKLTLENCGDEAILKGRLYYSPLLHPGQFGLDDTHMPENIWVRPPIDFESLAPTQSLSFEVEGYDLPGRFDGRRNQIVTLRCTRACNGLKSNIEEQVSIQATMCWTPIVVRSEKSVSRQPHKEYQSVLERLKSRMHSRFEWVYLIAAFIGYLFAKYFPNAFPRL